MLNGKVTYTHSTGEKEEYNYVNDVIQGKYTYYPTHNKYIIEGNYVDGLKQDEFTKIYKNGKKVKGKIVDGKIVEK